MNICISKLDDNHDQSGIKKLTWYVCRKCLNFISVTLEMVNNTFLI